MLEAVEVSIALAGAQVLERVSLTLEPGEVVVLIGPNGAGKSTLLACLSGALRPGGGSVRIDGLPVAELSPMELGRRRSVLEQNPTTSAPFIARDLIGLGIPIEIPPREARRMVIAAADATGLGALIDRPMSRLSGGEAHRAHMARALAQLSAGRALGREGWLLLDEPTASLDLAHQGSVLAAARRAAAEGAGVLAVLHDMTLAGALADRVALMHSGRIVACGPPGEILTPAVLAPVYNVDISIASAPDGARAIIPKFNLTQQGAGPCLSP
ncbi:MAG: ATP-binding cassette domain-containing protein [Pseudomonadota bacterium]